MKYEIVKSYDANELVQDVNRLINKGWKLQGGIAMASDNDGIQLFAQALVKASTGKTGDAKWELYEIESELQNFASAGKIFIGAWSKVRGFGVLAAQCVMAAGRVIQESIVHNVASKIGDAKWTYQLKNLIGYRLVV